MHDVARFQVHHGPVPSCAARPIQARTNFGVGSLGFFGDRPELEMLILYSATLKVNDYSC